jgi:hypothetical protein
MLKSVSTLVVVATIGLLTHNAASAQVQMTKLPFRIEEVLINPDLGAVLRSDLRVQSYQSKDSLLQEDYRDFSPALTQMSEPSYSNSNNRYRPPTPAQRDNLTAPGKTPRVADQSLETSIKVGDSTKSPDNEISGPANSSPKETDEDSGNASSLLVEPSSDQLKRLGQLKVQVSGASALIESQPGELIVEVFNPSKSPLGPVDVNVQVPEEITITRFDRDAWLDSERRIVAFRIDEVAPGQTQKIRMRGVSHNVGKTSLQVMLTSGNRMIAGRKFDTQVFPQQFAKKYSFGDTEPTTIQK